MIYINWYGKNNILGRNWKKTIEKVGTPLSAKEIWDNANEIGTIGDLQPMVRLLGQQLQHIATLILIITERIQL